MPEKVSKTEARYQEYPKATQRCGICSMFRPKNSCTKVFGDILKHAWCRFYEPKGK